MKESIELKEADRVAILTLMDNYVDVLLGSTEVVTRPPLSEDGNIPTDTLLAEHGLSLLITVFRGEQRHTVLFDTGYSQLGVPHNLDMLGANLDSVEAVVLSHGHMDHAGALYQLLDLMPGPVPLVLHPDALLSPRYFGLPDGRKLLFPQVVDREELEGRGIRIIERREPSLLADAMVAVTGQVERVTSFEKGLPNALIERGGNLEKDSIADDQSIVINIKDKGLAVISGCAHAGIINTILHARKITGVERIHTVLGGFHLSGPLFEPIIEETIGELQKMAPKVIVPMHCTGWNAVNRFAQAFPDSFVLNSVGSLFNLS
jgi:7,8-dihydropterin-6-yl-methyl-4-(beta-D-ribofuranosyl)aminobenzene 5'-phosphate synthase